MNKDLQKKFNSVAGLLNDSVISMILGALVVVLIAILAYNFYKSKANAPVEPQVQEVFKEELTEATATANLPTTYTVKAGDSLWSIAENFYTNGFNYKLIAQENKLDNASQIEVGQKLTIPAQNTAIVNANPNRIDGTSYTVVKGDSLWDIAVRAYGDGYRWTQLASANNLVQPNIIHSGNVLTIPRP